jgi:hypothetical protein
MEQKDKLLESCGDVAYELKELSRKDEKLASSYSEFVLAVKDLCHLVAVACAKENFASILSLAQSIKANAQLLLEVVRAMAEAKCAMSEQLLAKKRIARQLALLHKELASAKFTQQQQPDDGVDASTVPSSSSDSIILPSDSDLIPSPDSHNNNKAEIASPIVTEEESKNRTLAQSFEREVRILSESGRKRAKAPLFRRNLPDVGSESAANDETVGKEDENGCFVEPIDLAIETKIRQYIQLLSPSLIANESQSLPYAEMLNELRGVQSIHYPLCNLLRSLDRNL